jgi:hypothetical protein
VAGPDPGALDAVHAGAVPAEAVLEAADPPLTPGAPLDQPAKAPLALDQLAGGTGPAAAWNGDPGHAKVGQLLVDAGLAVAPVASHRPWRPAGAGDHPLDRGTQQRRIRRVAHHDLVVEHDPVGVVQDLSFVAELDRSAQPPLADRPGVRVVQADQPARPIPASHRPAECGPAPAAAAPLDGGLQLLEHRPEPTGALGTATSQGPAGVRHDPAGVGQLGLGQPGDLPGDLEHDLGGLVGCSAHRGC